MQVNKYELVEITIVTGSSGTRFNIPDQPKLRFTKLNAIEAYNATDLTASPSGVTPVSAANFKNSYLVLYNNGGEYLNRIPLIRLHQVTNGTDSYVRTLMQYQGQQISWEKSYILTGTSITAASTFSFLLGVYYTC